LRTRPCSSYRVDIIKDALRGAPFEHRIAYKQFAPGEIDVREIVAILAMFSPKLFDQSKQPVKAYSGKNSCLKLYRDEPEEFRRLGPIAKDVFALYNEIEKRMPEFYPGRYGRVKGVGYKNGEARFRLRFSGGTEASAYETPMGFAYPFLAAFRCLVCLDKATGYYRWHPAVDVFCFLNELGRELAEATVERSRTLGNNPNAVGKDVGHWAALYDKVKSRFLQRLYEERTIV